ncbi:MAG TPA: prenyltransferase/squalene oxidase repeat-containing protein [Solirubrobacterales bacterium]|nr:prenyltransferase/squalene oxidase repeat-containing protein [Solirubrobacterales bacterium]
MSWEMTSFLILGAVLVAGFVWYERSRPPSQVVALVAALAALAIAGRVAFAAFPNVKTTTDIVIFAGYALGGAPGFAAGALAALVSNFWFGQGPWTPWQMVAWGLCGVLGAVLALGIRNAGRLTLAATCGLAGIAFGALMNFSLMATYGGDLSWRHFWLLEVRAIPFEVAHVAGNVVFALLAGPAMVRMLTRFRERFEWSRGTGVTQPPPRFGGALRSGGIAALLLVCALGVFAPPAAHASDVSHAVHWLESQQRPSGGFPAAAEREPGAEMTAWVMLALAAADRNPLDVTNGGKTPVDFLRRHMGEVNDAGDIARTILALEASGVDPHDFAGENLVARLLDQRRQSGSYQGWPGTSAYAVLALRAAGANDAAAPTVEWLRKVQGKDGGWGNEPKEPSTAEVTGAVLQVLSPGSDASDSALSYMRKSKRDNGGFAPANNLSANAQATAWASQGLLASGKDPASFGAGKSSFAYMRDLQVSAGYFLQAPNQEASPVWVTADVLVPLSGHFLPIAAPARAPKPKAKKTKSSTTSVPPGGHEVHGIPKIFNQPGSSGSVPGGVAPKALGGGEGGAASGGSAHSGQGAPGIESGKPATGGSLPQGVPGAPESSSPTDASGEPAAETTDSGNGTAGSIVLGLLAGCLLFLLGLGARRGWMHWRYGL